MRYLRRIGLPQKVLDTLSIYQQVLDDKLAKNSKPEERGKLIERVWDNHRKTNTLKAAEKALEAMASGLTRCMYCEDSKGGVIEHRRPKADYPQHTFSWPNMLLACSVCNVQKNTAFDEQILDPTEHDPLDHLGLRLETGIYESRNGSKRGDVTLQKLEFLALDQTLIKGRLVAFETLCLFFKCYPVLAADEREKIRQHVTNAPFSGVFAAVLHAYREPNAPLVLGQDVFNTLKQYPEIEAWLENADKERAANAQNEIAKLAKGIRRKASPPQYGVTRIQTPGS